VTRALTELRGVAAPLRLANVDTDKILPSRFLKTVRRSGLGAALFDSLRHNPDGSINPDFILNREPWSRAIVLVALANFGCGSSREHAPWALLDFGIRCVIAPSFADIFHENCFKNGILPVALSRDEVGSLLEWIERPAQAELSVDLPRQTVRRCDAVSYHFNIDPCRKTALLQGQDEISRSLEHEVAIAAFEERRRRLSCFPRTCGPQTVDRD